VAHCLVHGRRNFVDIMPAFPKECEYVINTLAEVYKERGRNNFPNYASQTSVKMAFLA